jgi:hypothetical protein
MRLRMSAIAVVMLGCGSDCTPARKQSGPQQQQEVNQSGVISGTVVNQRGLPVAGATVTADELGRPFIGMRPWAETDPAGKFSIGRLVWGKYAVCVHKEADGYREICNNPFINDSAPTVTLSLQSSVASVRVMIGPKAGTVTGTVADSVTGLPVNPITNTVTGTRQAAVLRIRPVTDNGRYFDQAIGPHFTALIPPDADLELEVRAPGYQLWRFSLRGGRRGKPFRIQSGEKRILHIQLRPDLQ